MGIHIFRQFSEINVKWLAKRIYFTPGKLTSLLEKKTLTELLLQLLLPN